MKRVSFVSLLTVALVVLLVSGETHTVEAATCNPTELSPCLPAFTSGTNPSSSCCGKLMEQKPCFCGYIRNPNLKQYVNSPNARKVASKCGVVYPKC